MKTPSRFSHHRGFTIPELLTTIAVLGMLCGIAIASYSGLHNTAREAVAQDTAAVLNRALLHYNQSNGDITIDAKNSSGTDELTVLRGLQWRDPDRNKATPGSPYISERFTDTISSSDEDYRIRWNGHAFEVIAPGTAGTGLKTGTLQTEGESSTYVFPADYTPPAAGQHE
jgi:prepilin-type N-terminal cleavage/methylation domain-containing protein